MKDTTLTIRISTEEKKLLQKIARIERRSVGNLVLTAVAQQFGQELAKSMKEIYERSSDKKDI